MNTIAVVDDSEDTCEVIQALLEGAGHHVESFMRPETFLTRLQTTEFDLILMDLGMPSINGYDLLKRIRREGCNVPVLAVTAFAYNADREKALQAGFLEFIAKPIKDIPGFLRLVSLHLNKASRTPKE